MFRKQPNLFLLKKSEKSERPKVRKNGSEFWKVIPSLKASDFPTFRLPDFSDFRTIGLPDLSEKNIFISLSAHLFQNTQGYFYENL